MAARIFLYVIAGLIVLTLAAAIGWNLFQDQIMRAAFVPSATFEESATAPAPDYATKAAWLARPDLPRDPARWTPKGFKAAGAEAPVAVFYIAPTTYVRRDRWNAPLDDAEANALLDRFTRGQASAFNGIGAVWAPRYRSASAGAFMTDRPDALHALNLAWSDVIRAWDTFLAAIPADKPILLAAHSQGSLHLLRLLRDRVAGKPITKRIVAVYAAGWPISIPTDLPALGLPGCAGPGQTGCILSWQSFGEPADPRLVMEVYDAGNGFTGVPRKGTPMLCVNPITGAPGTAALPAANLGALVPGEEAGTATLVAGKIPARCDRQGFLLIGAAPEGFDGYVMPGENYHVFDYSLFWANIRADAETRTRAFLAQ